MLGTTEQGNIRAIERVIRDHQDFIITTHLNPDADAIGSSCALMLALQSLGKNARIINASPTPDNLIFLSGSPQIEVYKPDVHDAALRTVDVLFCLDLNVLKRTGEMQHALSAREKTTIMIDHHTDPEPFYTHALHDDDATSTAELIFKTIQQSFPEVMSPDIAQNLYAGIMADTGNFRFPRVTSDTHRIIAMLIDAGADPVAIYDTMYNSWSFGRTTFLGEALSGMQLYCDAQFCVMIMTNDMMRRHGCTEDSVESAVQHTLTIAGVRCGALIAEREQEGEVKISLRSKGDVYINGIAAKFGGGGHVYAAGARAKNTTIEAVRTQLVAHVCELLKSRS